MHIVFGIIVENTGYLYLLIAAIMAHTGQNSMPCRITRRALLKPDLKDVYRERPWRADKPVPETPN